MKERSKDKGGGPLQGRKNLVVIAAFHLSEREGDTVTLVRTSVTHVWLPVTPDTHDLLLESIMCASLVSTDRHHHYTDTKCCLLCLIH